MLNFTRFIAVATVAGALSGALTGPVQAQDANTVLARVNSAEITLGHLIALRGQLPQQFAQIPDERLFPVLVEQLIEQELMAQGIAGNLSTVETLMLANETRNFLANAALVGAVQAAVTEESIQTAYDAFAAEYAQGEPITEYNASHILVREDEKRDEVVAALAAGTPFAEVAASFSIDGTAQNGGNLGWFRAGMMIPDFQAAVEALEPGQVSEPVQTQFGWHVIQLNETRTAAVPALEEVREELVEQLQREASTAFIDSLREGATVENLAEGVDPTLLSRRDLLDE